MESNLQPTCHFLTGDIRMKKENKDLSVTWSTDPGAHTRGIPRCLFSVLFPKCKVSEFFLSLYCHLSWAMQMLPFHHINSKLEFNEILYYIKPSYILVSFSLLWKSLSKWQCHSAFLQNFLRFGRFQLLFHGIEQNFLCLIWTELCHWYKYVQITRMHFYTVFTFPQLQCPKQDLTKL